MNDNNSPRFSNPKFPCSEDQLAKVAPYKPHTYTIPIARRLKLFIAMRLRKFLKIF